MLMLLVLSFDDYAIGSIGPVLMLPDCFFLSFFNRVLMLHGFFFIFENLNITMKTSALDYNGERDLSSIINCVILRL
jgi:hypothetical protein